MMDETGAEPLVRASHPVQRSDTASETLARQTVDDLLAMRIIPVPRNYELWYTHLSGTNPQLSQRLNDLAAEHGSITHEMLESAYQLHLENVEADKEAIGSAASEIESAAGDLLKRLAVSQAPLQDYSATLDAFPERIREASTLKCLAGSIAALAGETARALEHNRSLQEQVDRSARRISTLRQSLANVRRTATTDALTGLLNRRAFEARARRAVGQEGDELWTLLIADIDHFKLFNDLHGHHTGDLVLRLVARLLEQNVKGRDTVGRYGGEEFAILLAGANGSGGEAVGRQICEAISAKSLVDKSSQRTVGRITLSIGVAQHRPGERLSALMERADSALYMAKRTGRNRVLVALD